MAESETKVRLHVEDDLAAGGRVALAPDQAHYVGRVMRLGPGDALALFNGRDGEWLARITQLARNDCVVDLERLTRPQSAPPDLWLMFAPIKRARIDFVATKATELGAAAMWPVFTRNTAVGRVNAERLRANAVEAAEQCGRLDVPAVFEPTDLDRVLAGWSAERRILLCDESGGAAPIADVLAGFEDGGAAGPWAVLTGPEGGFARSELDALAILPFVYAAGLGPRILRADTAAVAALAIWQALLGDWGDPGSGSA